MTSAIPNLESEYPVSADSIADYRRDGHVLLRSVCSPDEIASYGEVIVDCVRRHNREDRPMEKRDTYGKAFLQTMNLWEVDESIKRFTFARRFAKLAAELMGVDAVRLYHDQALFKEAGGGHTPWHQDQYYWPLETDRTITMWMPLVHASTEMGTMRFASGSHKEGYLGPIAISDESEALFTEFVEQKGYEIAESGHMEAGDATFHSGWTLHSAGSNQTETMREAMTIIYYP